MNPEEYAACDAMELAERVRSRQVSASELVELALAAIEKVNPRLNAISQVFADMARKTVPGDGPFKGVPFLLKDIGLAMAGTRILGGSRLLADAPLAGQDCELVARFRAAGLIIAGRTTTPEFGASSTTEGIVTGITRNPWHPDHSAGGSSGGSAAAVAAGIVPAAQGGDGGGSLRIPAACCGLFAVKPTRQRFPTGPDGGDPFFGMSVPGVMTRSVRDSAALMDAACGPDIGAPYWAPPPERPYLAELERDPGRMRIALAEQSLAGEFVHPDCRAAVLEAAKLLEDLGHIVVPDQPAYDHDGFMESLRTILFGGIEFGIDAAAAELGKTPSPETLEPFTLTLYRESQGRSASDFIRACQFQGNLGRRVGAFFQTYDVLLTPSMALPPVPIGYLKRQDDSAEDYVKRASAYLPFQPLFNATGQPAANIPFAVNADGLPIGIQIAARFGEEAAIFRLAGQIERARPWAKRRPRIHIGFSP